MINAQQHSMNQWGKSKPPPSDMDAGNATWCIKIANDITSAASL
jgi:hypothetical protein